MSDAPGKRPECETCAKRLRGTCLVFLANSSLYPSFVNSKGVCTAYRAGRDGQWIDAEKREYDRQRQRTSNGVAGIQRDDDPMSPGYMRGGRKPRNPE